MHVASKQFPRANVSSHPQHHGQTWEVKKLISCTQIAIDTLQGHENTACCKQTIPTNNNNAQYLFRTRFQGRCCPDSKTFHQRGRGLLKIGFKNIPSTGSWPPEDHEQRQHARRNPSSTHAGSHPRGRGLLKMSSSGSMLDVIDHLPKLVARICFFARSRFHEGLRRSSSASALLHGSHTPDFFLHDLLCLFC